MNTYYEASEQDDQIQGTAGNEVLRGGGGNDFIEAGAGADLLDGGTGNDTLIGGEGNDTYLFNPGDGSDIIIDQGGTDVIKLGTGIAPADVELRRDAQHLFLSMANGADQVLVAEWFSADNSMRVESVRFADNTVWGASVLAAAKFAGTADGDRLQGTDGADRLEGRGGDDVLQGGAGNDTYLFNRGDGRDFIIDQGGTDLIKFGAGIAPADVDLWRDAQHLYLSMSDGADRVMIAEWFTGDNSLRVESVRFADNTVWSASVLAAAKFVGTADEDRLQGTDGADRLEGRGGDDVLQGGAGNDTYLFNRGDGHDFIIDQGGTDVIKFGAGIAPAGVDLWRDAQHLYLSMSDGADQVMIAEWFSGDNSMRVESVRFADNTVWGASVLAAAKFAGTGNSDRLQGTDGADKLEGRGGGDMLEGQAGNDTYLFNQGWGKDVIFDSAGTDRIQFGAGITPDNVTVWRNSSDLYLGSGSSDTILVAGFFASKAMQIESVSFADGTVWNTARLMSAALLGTSGGDSLEGGDMADVLSGLAGDDMLSGMAGNDTLDGGAGDDGLFGGEGNDTYLFDVGSGRDLVFDSGGTDTIRFGPSITRDAVQIWRDSSDLHIDASNGADQLTLARWFDDTANRVESIRFADGTTLGTAQLAVAKFVGTSGSDGMTGSAGNDVMEGDGGDDGICGEAGNDTLNGGAGNDFLNGGAGNDTLNGGADNDFLDGAAGNDIYLFGRGAGQDIVRDTAGVTDVIRINANTAPSAVVLSRHGDDLQLNIAGTGDTLIVDDWFYSVEARVESVRFSDGTVWGAATLAKAAYAIVEVPTAFADIVGIAQPHGLIW